MNQDDLKKIENTSQPTAGKGLALDHNGLIPSPLILAPGVPTDGQVPAFTAATNQLAWSTVTPTLAQLRTLGAVTVYDRATTTVDVASTLAETSIYSKSVTGGDMSTNRMLRLTCFGDYLHNNVAGDSIRLKVKFGGTTFFDDTDNLNAAAITTRQPWVWDVLVANLGATNSQMITTKLSVSGSTALTAGIGSLEDIFRSGATGGGFQGGVGGISTLATIDTTAASTLDVTVQWSASSANNSWRMRYSVLELV